MYIYVKYTKKTFNEDTSLKPLFTMFLSVRRVIPKDINQETKEKS